MRVDWDIWITDVKHLLGGPKFDARILRDAFDLYCEGCSAREAENLLSRSTILEKDVSDGAHV